MINNRKVKSAAIWASIEAGTSVLLSFISIIYLARVLHPEDYGYVATAQIISSIIGIIFSFGLTEAVIQRKIFDEKVKETAFLASLIFCFIAIVISIAIFIILYYSSYDKIISYIFAFETLGIVFNILSLVPTALLLRDLKMSAFTKRTLISRLLFFAFAVPLALYGYGVWSIVFGNFIQYISSMILIFWAIRKELPKKLSFNKKIFTELFSFGFYVMAENILWSVLSRVFSLLIAIFHGTYALGLYNMASRLTDSVLTVLNTVISRMALPLFSHVQDDKEKLGDIFAKATHIFNSISMPAFIGMALTASFWVPVILGDSWIAVIPVVQVISIMYAIMYSRIFVGTAMKAVGQSKRFLILSGISAILSVVTVLLTKDLVLIQTISAWAILRVIITIPIGVYLMRTILDIKVMPQFKPIIQPFLCSIIMSVVLIILENKLQVYNYSNLLMLITLTACGIVIYLLSFYISRLISKLHQKA